MIISRRDIARVEIMLFLHRCLSRVRDMKVEMPPQRDFSRIAGHSKTPAHTSGSAASVLLNVDELFA
jgi:hypothetical protein